MNYPTSSSVLSFVGADSLEYKIGLHRDAGCHSLLNSLRLYLDTFILEVFLSDIDKSNEKTTKKITIEDRETVQNILTFVERYNEGLKGMGEGAGESSCGEIEVLIDRKHDGNVFHVEI